MHPAAANKHFLHAFYIGLAAVMLSLWMWFIPDWLTFIHTWRVELFASVFLLLTLLFIFLRTRDLSAGLPFSPDEQKFIVLPIAAFILWSCLSTVWAPSWKSAVHHTLVWSEYLIFYCIVRYLLERRGQYKNLLYVFTATLVLYSLPALAGYVAFSIFGGTNNLGIGFARFGEQILLVLPLVIVAVVRLHGRSLVMGVAVVAMLWLLMLSTFGRTNYVLVAVAVVATGAVIFIFRRFRDYRGRFAIVAAVLTIASLLAIGIPAIATSESAGPTHRFQNQSGLTASNNFRKLMISLSVEMISTHPVVGIGADNFGFEVHRYREAYATRNPNDPNLGAAESELPERAHNEYLQIFAELGAVGLAIFVWFLVGIAFLAVRCLTSRRRVSLQAYAALIGIALFLASSLVTSYSFRLIQNGFVFFFVLAVAAKLLFRRHDDPFPVASPTSPLVLRSAVAAGIIACLLHAAYSTTRVASVIVSQRANTISDLNEATALYETAISLDSENPRAMRTLGTRLFNKERYPEAAAYLSRSVDMGLATSTGFSFLASAQSLAGDNAAAEGTMNKAAILYPSSVFALVRYASLLAENGKTAEAEEVFARAIKIDPKSAKTWQSMITRGAKVTSDRSVLEEDILPVMELRPGGAIYAVNIERLIKFPEERKFSMMQPGGVNLAELPGNK